MLLFCFYNITLLLLPECDFHLLQGKQRLPLLCCCLRLFTGSTRSRGKCWYCNVFACFCCRCCDVKPSSRRTSALLQRNHDKYCSFCCCCFYFLWRKWKNVSRSPQTDHCSSLIFCLASEQNKALPSEHVGRTEWTAQTGGAVMPPSLLTMHPPATISKTQLVKMKLFVWVTAAAAAYRAPAGNFCNKGRKKLGHLWKPTPFTIVCVFPLYTWKKKVFILLQVQRFLSSWDTKVILKFPCSVLNSCCCLAVAHIKAFSSSNDFAELTDTLLANAPESENVFRFSARAKKHIPKLLIRCARFSTTVCN